MAKRRPTAEDRDIAKYLADLPPGEHRIIVEAPSAPSCLRQLGMPRLKREGGMIWSLANGRVIEVIPHE